MKVVGKSNIGLIRASNQDNYLIVHNEYGNTLAVVCDGIGGAKAGEVASLMATKSLGKAFSESTPFLTLASGKLWLEKTLREINDEIFKATKENTDYEGMGTTLVAALIINNEAVIANVGDSRAYVLLNKQLIQITSDHSLVNDLVKKGEISADDVEFHPQRNILTNALGAISTLKIDTFLLNRGNLLLLCSDGLSSYVKEDVILDILLSNKPIEDKLDLLINEANLAGGYDNITAIIIDKGDIINE